MVVIIRHGELPEEKSYETTCRHCNTIFVFERHEARLVRDQRDGDFLKIACPLCKTKCTAMP